jgi:hypothetical protein
LFTSRVKYFMHIQDENILGFGPFVIMTEKYGVVVMCSHIWASVRRNII